ncbi:unnamed protein product (macronuclear) [Paramecium tetraurelia]|uniref:Transmembrane protein n=1 Tax=Paramecium tetraurelia TaxID=5888 RepID=A0E2D7_PARTE|nr:uncharacterized protein GSPATT00022626001 [Paramecium tetraurelia]CAK89454.1 unnamed protein product [Paramecium tetraurelia]|eukprot:XP_001456851.1 hypothetical protein (macronuclear) [Paramecium tetraurelia strain d4-2]
MKFKEFTMQITIRQVNNYFRLKFLFSFSQFLFLSIKLQTTLLFLLSEIALFINRQILICSSTLIIIICLICHFPQNSSLTILLNSQLYFCITILSIVAHLFSFINIPLPQLTISQAGSKSTSFNTLGKSILKHKHYILDSVAFIQQVALNTICSTHPFQCSTELM